MKNTIHLIAGLLLASFLMLSCQKMQLPETGLSETDVPAAIREALPLTPDEIILHGSLAACSYKVLFLPAGFTAEELSEDGPFLKAACYVSDVILSCPPFVSRSGDVCCSALPLPSKKSGIEETDGTLNPDTFFGLVKLKKSSTRRCDDALAARYKDAYLGGLDKEQCLPVIIFNSSSAVGITYQYINASDLQALVLLPVSCKTEKEYRGMIIHEAVGHGFGFLADEYYYTDEKHQYPDEGTIARLLQNQQRGACLNVAVEGYDIPWEKEPFCIKTEKLWKGGYTFKNGIYRSSGNSVMNDNYTSHEFNEVSLRIIQNRARYIFKD